MDIFKVDDLKEYLEGLKRLFDIVRVVNPISKKVVFQNGYGDSIIHGEDCYGVWKKGEACSNCISSKAIQDKKCFTKIEYLGDGVYIVIASPIIFEDNLYVLELVKDITETGVVTGLNGLNTMEANNIIYTLNEKVIKDDLTGVYNKRHINKRLPIDIDYAKKHREKLTVAMMDIDSFKKINDIYGHMVGDLVLKKIAEAISSEVRVNYDWVARYGGDEFLIVLKNLDETAAMEIMKRIQSTVRKMIIRFEDSIINVTLSIGFHTIDTETENFSRIVSKVDQNLKKAKDGGKNRIV